MTFQRTLSSVPHSIVGICQGLKLEYKLDAKLHIYVTLKCKGFTHLMELVQIVKSLKFGSCTPLFKEYHPAKKSVEQESKRKQKTKIPTFCQKIAI